MADRYIIDTNVVLQYPEVLAMAAGKKIVIPQAVLEELQHARLRGVQRGVQDVIAEAIGKGAHVAPTPASIKQEPIASDRAAQRLSGADIAIARIAIDYAERMGTKTVCVVTADRALVEFLGSRGISAISGRQFLTEPSIGKVDKKIEVTAKKIISNQRRYLIISFALGIVSALFGNFAFSNIQYLITTISIWGTLIALPVLGIGLYWYRERFRLSYGVFEFIVGVIMTYYIFFPNFDYSKIGPVEAIQILGGLYVMVRGLDNVGKGTEGTRLEQLWKKLF
ncbi:PIN domain-containing protein [Aeromonas veronii]|uniref:PIN domain-containing protein n=1 Tax=Aeromonas veronii TaxID=654 RepID=UPI001F1D1BFE|nr:PIN domain-containing protein [Aeromonas veronii]MCF5894037.1 hypothetical protein [Aeromonas veronii]